RRVVSLRWAAALTTQLEPRQNDRLPAWEMPVSGRLRTLTFLGRHSNVETTREYGIFAGSRNGHGSWGRDRKYSACVRLLLRCSVDNGWPRDARGAASATGESRRTSCLDRAVHIAEPSPW